MARPQMVLVVEDDQELRHLLRNALSLAGYDVQEARSGFEVLRLVDSTPPDLVILDLALPGIDGYAVRHELATHVHTRHVPIVTLTGSTDDLESLKVNYLLRKDTSPTVGELQRAIVVGVLDLDSARQLLFGSRDIFSQRQHLRRHRADLRQRDLPHDRLARLDPCRQLRARLYLPQIQRVPESNDTCSELGAFVLFHAAAPPA